MSKTTMRKRISLTVVAALTAGVLTSVATGPAANAHTGIVGLSGAAGVINAPAAAALNGAPRGLYVAETLSSTGAAVLADFSDATTLASQTSVANARSLGLLTKSATTSTAQTATMLTSGVLSLYYITTATVTALTATGGTFTVGSKGITPTMNQTRTTALFGATATGVGQLWTAPSTAGTYTISLYSHGAGAVPTLDTPAGTLASAIVVTVVAASAGGKYDASESFCAISNTAASFTQASNVDSTAATVNGGSMYINFALNDSYGKDLTDGNIVVTATGGANVAYADGGAVSAGTSGTAVAYDEGAGDSIRVTQGTADAPTSSTVTISYNGTTICTKTVGFAGAPSKMTVVVSQTQDLSGSGGKSDFLKDGYNRSGLFTVLLTDAAGNQVAAGANSEEARASAIGTFSTNSASLAGQTIVTSITVDSPATQTSTTLGGRLSTGIYTCGATAGEVKTAKLDFTITATGKIITSDAFTLRCADDPYSYTASFDKASYVQGDLAVLTVSFLDSKGNAANSVTSTGGWTSNMPMLTNVTTTGAAASLGTTGTAKYTYTVGTPSGMTAGTYTSIVDFTTLTAAKTAVVSTPTYKLSTGGDTTSNADILKSIVALIASINKQIQALQKLILKR